MVYICLLSLFYFDRNSKLPEGTPNWSISQSYGSDVQSQDEIDNINDEPNKLDE
ncbi:hypothetical protein RhiirC2_800233 [Rhizophagus irregularis]|uniref:Uncharacterized protein n=1 Tax=Rhizophagus irregularis TaxID=588596 RepID=A0A2N1M3Y5_9GLOM|nr:hypothetical protein RhiirC2_800233 [Rhizophagus irregularis]